MVHTNTAYIYLSQVNTIGKNIYYSRHIKVQYQMMMAKLFHSHSLALPIYNDYNVVSNVGAIRFFVFFKGTGNGTDAGPGADS